MCSILLKEIHGIRFGSKINHLKVQVGSGRVPGCAQRAYHITLEYTLAATNKYVVQVCVECLPTISMVNNNEISVPVIAPSSVDNNSAVRCPDLVSNAASDIYRRMDRWSVMITG
jgi:hypothetical protein